MFSPTSIFPRECDVVVRKLDVLYFDAPQIQFFNRIGVQHASVDPNVQLAFVPCEIFDGISALKRFRNFVDVNDRFLFQFVERSFGLCRVHLPSTLQHTVANHLMVTVYCSPHEPEAFL